MQSLCMAALVPLLVLARVLYMYIKNQMTVASYTPMTLLFERPEEVPLALQHTDVVLLPGTRIKAVENTRVRFMDAEQKLVRKETFSQELNQAAVLAGV